MSHLLAIRFSALGDVAMTLPVLYSYAHLHPTHRITLVSRVQMGKMLVNAPDNLTFYGVDLKAPQYKGVFGLWRLFRELKALRPDAVADLHDVLRTQVLRTLFRLHGVRVAVIQKGRWEKRQLVKEGTERRLLKTSFQRYADTVQRLQKETFPLPFRSVYETTPPDASLYLPLTGEKGETAWVGIAPFAAHAGKIYPLHQMEEVVRQLTERGVRVFLFGGGKKEEAVLNSWAEKYPHTLSLAGKMKMDGELALMSALDLMISMDSGNMHLASLVGTRVLSIWGATHRFAGFMGWGQKEADAVEITDLSCRPCSIFGNKPCRRGDYACLHRITPLHIVEKVIGILAPATEMPATPYLA